MENRINNLQELSKQLDLNIFYSINFFNEMSTTLQGKVSQESLRQMNVYCNDFRCRDGMLESNFEFEDMNYRVVLTF